MNICPGVTDKQIIIIYTHTSACILTCTHTHTHYDTESLTFSQNGELHEHVHVELLMCLLISLIYSVVTNNPWNATQNQYIFKHFKMIANACIQLSLEFAERNTSVHCQKTTTHKHSNNVIKWTTLCLLSESSWYCRLSVISWLQNWPLGTSDR